LPRGRGRFGRGMAGAGGRACEMGNLYRFAEPIILLTLARLDSAHGYQITQQAVSLAVTHAGLDSAVVYRTLRRLEEVGQVISQWDVAGPGPAKRTYQLTEAGVAHLGEWAQVLGDVSSSLKRLQKECQAAFDKAAQNKGKEKGAK